MEGRPEGHVTCVVPFSRTPALWIELALGAPASGGLDLFVVPLAKSKAVLRTEAAANLGGPWELQAVRIANANTTQTRLLVEKPETQAFYRVVVLP